MRKQKAKILLTALIFSFNAVLCAVADDFSQKELMDKVSSLADEVAKLKTTISNLQNKQSTVEQKVERIASIPSTSSTSAAEGIETKNKVKLYGFLKLDATYDDAKTNDVDASRYATSTATSADEKDFSMTARNSRIGLKYYVPEEFDAKVYGNLELDFYDTSSAYHSSQLRMRHAFAEIQYPKWSLLAGQTGDVFGPLGPNTLNTNGYLWNGGNIGFRRAQIRLTNNFDITGDNKITTQLSMNRNADTAANMPVMESRIAYSFPVLGKTSTIGIAGLYGRDKNGTDRIPQWACGLDLSMPLTKKLSIDGELFKGSNLDDFLAGIGQGVNTTKNDGIGTMGGWAQLSFKPKDKYCFNAGYGIETPDKKDLNAGNRYRNDVAYANVMYSLLKDVKLGLEYSYFRTKYLDSTDGQNNKITTSFIYNF